MGRNNQPVLKQATLNFTAKPDGPYGDTWTARRPSSDTSSTCRPNTTLASTSPLLSPTSPPLLTTKPTTGPDSLTGAISKLKNSPPIGKELKEIIDTLEDKCDSIKQDFADWKDTLYGILARMSRARLELNYDIKNELDKKLD